MAPCGRCGKKTKVETIIREDGSELRWARRKGLLPPSPAPVTKTVETKQDD